MAGHAPHLNPESADDLEIREYAKANGFMIVRRDESAQSLTNRWSLPHRPLADSFINRGLQPDGARQRRDDALIMRQVIIGKLPPLAVFQPLLAHLI